jgi:membrane protein DedA with SNARE-associated domain
VVWLTFESAGTPLPNEAVLLFTGFVSGTGRISPPLVVLAGVAGSLCGALISYSIGRVGGRAAVRRVGAYIWLTPERLERAEGWFRAHGRATIFIARLTPVVRTVISYPAGLARMEPLTFVLSTLAGSLIWCSAMVAAGWWAGRNYEEIVRGAERLGPVAAVIVVAAVGVYVLFERRIKGRLFG